MRWTAVGLLWVVSAAFGQVDEAQLLKLVEQADTIVAGSVMKVEDGPDGRLLSVAGGMGGQIKGPDYLSRQRVLVPAANTAPFAPRDTGLFFLRLDREHARYELLAGPLPAKRDDPLLDRVRGLVAAANPLVLRMAPGRDSYLPGETVTLLWHFENKGDKPLKIVPKLDPLSYRLGGMSTGWTNSLPSAGDLVTLAPGQALDHVEALNDLNPEWPGYVPQLFPVGTMRGEMNYRVTSDSVVTAGARGVAREPELAMNHAVQAFSITIRVPNAEETAAALAKLSSTFWTDQLAGLTTLTASPASAGRAEVRALLRHPWARIRTLAAKVAMPAFDQVTPELVDLLWDPSYEVRDAAIRAAATRRLTGLAWPVYVLTTVHEEAQAAGIQQNLSSPRRTLSGFGADPRLGDVIDDQLAQGRLEQAGLLDQLQPREQRVLRFASDKATAEQVAAIRAKWAAMRDQVADRYTPEQLAADQKRCRERLYADLPANDVTKQVIEVCRALRLWDLDTSPTVARLRALDAGAAPTVLAAIRGTHQYCECPALLDWLVAHPPPGLADYLLARSYTGSYFAPEALRRVAPERFAAHLRGLLPVNGGAAILAAETGDKTVLPHLLVSMAQSDDNFWKDRLAKAANKLTGETRTVADWLTWWQQQPKP